MKWEVKKVSDVFFYDDGCEGYREFNVVSNGKREFRSDEDADLEWLCQFLNRYDPDES